MKRGTRGALLSHPAMTAEPYGGAIGGTALMRDLEKSRRATVCTHTQYAPIAPYPGAKYRVRVVSS